MADYTQAEQTAEKLLHIGSLTYRQISKITDIPVWHVKSLAQDVTFARNSDLRYLRHVLFLMKRASADTPPQMVNVFTRCMERAQKLLYNRDILERERISLRDYAVNLSAQQLQELLLQLYLFSTLPDMQLISSMQTFTDSIYAHMLRDVYDNLSDEYREQDDGDENLDPDEPEDSDDDDKLTITDDGFQL